MNNTSRKACRILIMVTAVAGGASGIAQAGQTSPSDCRASYYGREIGQVARTCTDVRAGEIASTATSRQMPNTNRKTGDCSGSYYSFDVGELPRNCAVNAMVVRSSGTAGPEQVTTPPNTRCRGSYYSFEIGEQPRNCKTNDQGRDS